MIHIINNDGEHSLWSPSSLHRRMTCPGSAEAEEGLPDSSSEVAAEGTAAHFIREQCLRNPKVDVIDFVGDTVVIMEAGVERFRFDVEADWPKMLQPGIDRLRELGGMLLVETRIDLGAVIPGQGGTLDAAVITEDTIYVDDLKFGRTAVDVEMNPQLMAYAYGLLVAIKAGNFGPTPLKVKNPKLVLSVDQPRAYGRGGEWETTLGEIEQFAAELYLAYRDHEGGPRIPNLKACTYCKAADHCPELANEVIDLMFNTEGDTWMIPESERLGVDQLGKILVNAGLIKKALERYSTRATELLRAGNKVPGMKLVEGEGRRDWIDESEAEEFLLSKIPKHQAFNFKLKSPAQCENILGTRNWAKAQALIGRTPGKPQLALETDKRPALIPVVNVFDDETTTDDFDDLI